MHTTNPWIQHVQAYAKQHGCSYRTALQRSRASYTPTHRGSRGPTAAATSTQPRRKSKKAEGARAAGASHGRHDRLYRLFKRYALTKDAFINMEHGLGAEIVPHPEFVTYKTKQTWKDLHCPGVRSVGPFVVATECRTPDGTREIGVRDPSRYKVFVEMADGKRLRNLADYVRMIQSGHISESDHNQLFQFIEEQRVTVQEMSRTTERVIAFNHNMDVAVLHFKFRCTQEYKCARVGR